MLFYFALYPYVGLIFPCTKQCAMVPLAIGPILHNVQSIIVDGITFWYFVLWTFYFHHHLTSVCFYASEKSTAGLSLIRYLLKNMRSWRRSKWSLIFWTWFLGTLGMYLFLRGLECGLKCVLILAINSKWCRTSADLFKTVFDLLVSVTVFVGRFDMRMMQVTFYFFLPVVNVVSICHLSIWLEVLSWLLYILWKYSIYNHCHSKHLHTFKRDFCFSYSKSGVRQC